MFVRVALSKKEKFASSFHGVVLPSINSATNYLVAELEKLFLIQTFLFLYKLLSMASH